MDVISQIGELGNRLYFKGGWKRCPVWINTQRKRKRNPKSILKVLKACWENKPEEPWAYCEAAIKKESPKQNAMDHAAQFRGEGDIFLQIANDLKKLYGGNNAGREKESAE